MQSLPTPPGPPVELAGKQPTDSLAPWLLGCRGGAPGVMSSMEDDVKQMMRQYQYLEHNRKVRAMEGAVEMVASSSRWRLPRWAQEYAKDAANTIARQQKMIEMLKGDNEVRAAV